jgi:hypothetical protein
MDKIESNQPSTYLIDLVERTNKERYEKIDVNNLIKQDLNLYEDGLLHFIDKTNYEVYSLDLTKFILQNEYCSAHYLTSFFSFVRDEYNLIIKLADETFSNYFPDVDTSLFIKKHKNPYIRELYIDKTNNINLEYLYIDEVNLAKYVFEYNKNYNKYIWTKEKEKLHETELLGYDEYKKNVKYDLELVYDTSRSNRFGKNEYYPNFNEELNNVSDEALIERNNNDDDYEDNNEDDNDEDDDSKSVDSNTSYLTIDTDDYGYYDFYPRKIKKSDARKINEYSNKIRSLFNDKQLRYLITNKFVSNLYFNNFMFSHKIDDLNTIHLEIDFSTSVLQYHLIDIKMWLNNDNTSPNGFASYVDYDIETFTKCDSNNVNKKR